MKNFIYKTINIFLIVTFIIAQDSIAAEVIFKKTDFNLAVPSRNSGIMGAFGRELALGMKDAAVFYAINRIIAEYLVEKGSSVSSEGLKEYLEYKLGDSMDRIGSGYSAIYKKGKSFCLPYVDAEGKRMRVRYFLKDEMPGGVKGKKDLIHFVAGSPVCYVFEQSEEPVMEKISRHQIRTDTTSSAIAVVKEGEIWKQYEINAEQHNIINEVWRRLWKKSDPLSADNWLVSIIKAELVKRDIYDKKVFIYTPSDNFLYDMIYNLSREREIFFPPREMFKLITHPGSYSRGGTTLPVSCNLLIPEKVLTFLEKCHKSDEIAFENWLDHEMAHLTDKIKNGSRISEQEISEKYSLFDFLDAYSLEASLMGFNGGGEVINTKKDDFEKSNKDNVPGGESVFYEILNCLFREKAFSGKTALAIDEIILSLNISKETVSQGLTILTELEVVSERVKKKPSEKKGFYIPVEISGINASVGAICAEISSIIYINSGKGLLEREKKLLRTKELIKAGIEELRFMNLDKFMPDQDWAAVEDTPGAGEKPRKKGKDNNVPRTGAVDMTKIKEYLAGHKIDFIKGESFYAKKYVDSTGQIMLEGLTDPVRIISSLDERCDAENYIKFVFTRRSNKDQKLYIYLYDKNREKYGLVNFYSRKNKKYKPESFKREELFPERFMITRYLNNEKMGLVREEYVLKRAGRIDYEGKIHFYPLDEPLKICARGSKYINEVVDLRLFHDRNHGNILETKAGEEIINYHFRDSKGDISYLKPVNAILDNEISLTALDLIAFFEGRGIEPLEGRTELELVTFEKHKGIVRIGSKDVHICLPGTFPGRRKVKFLLYKRENYGTVVEIQMMNDKGIYEATACHYHKKIIDKQTKEETTEVRYFLPGARDEKCVSSFFEIDMLRYKAGEDIAIANEKTWKILKRSIDSSGKIQLSHYELKESFQFSSPGDNTGLQAKCVFSRDTNHGLMLDTSTLAPAGEELCNRYYKDSTGKVISLKGLGSRKELIDKAELDFIKYFKGEDIHLLKGRTRIKVKAKVNKEGKAILPMIGVIKAGEPSRKTERDLVLEFTRDQELHGLMVKCIVDGVETNRYFRDGTDGTGEKWKITHFKAREFSNLQKIRDLVDLDFRAYLKGRVINLIPDRAKEITAPQKVRSGGNMNFFDIKKVKMKDKYKGKNPGLSFLYNNDGDVVIRCSLEGKKIGYIYYNQEKKVPVFVKNINKTKGPLGSRKDRKGIALAFELIAREGKLDLSKTWKAAEIAGKLGRRVKYAAELMQRLYALKIVDRKRKDKKDAFEYFIGKYVLRKADIIMELLEGELLLKPEDYHDPEKMNEIYLSKVWPVIGEGLYNREQTTAAIAIVKKNGIWEQHILSRGQHRVINQAWADLWNDEYRVTDKQWLFEDIKDILEDEGIEGFKINIHSPPGKILYQKIYELAGKKNVDFPPKERFKLITHPGTGSGGGRRESRSVNLLIPREVMSFLEEIKSVDGSMTIYEQWLEHEISHVIDKIRVSFSQGTIRPAGEREITQNNGIFDFLDEYVKRVFKDEKPGSMRLSGHGEEKEQIMFSGGKEGRNQSLIMEILADNMYSLVFSWLIANEAFDYDVAISAQKLSEILQRDRVKVQTALRILKTELGILERHRNGKEFLYCISDKIIEFIKKDEKQKDYIRGLLKMLPVPVTPSYEKVKKQIKTQIEELLARPGVQEPDTGQDDAVLMENGNFYKNLNQTLRSKSPGDNISTEKHDKILPDTKSPKNSKEALKRIQRFFNGETVRAGKDERITYIYETEVSASGECILAGVEDPLKVCSGSQKDKQGKQYIKLEFCNCRIIGEKIKISVFNRDSGKFTCSNYYLKNAYTGQINSVRRNDKTNPHLMILLFLRGASTKNLDEKAIYPCRGQAPLKRIDQGKTYIPGYGKLTVCPRRKHAGKAVQLELLTDPNHGRILKCMVEVSPGNWKVSNIYYRHKKTDKLRHLLEMSRTKKMLGLAGMDIMGFLRLENVEVIEEGGRARADFLTAVKLDSNGYLQFAFNGRIHLYISSDPVNVGKRARLVLVKDEVLGTGRLDCYVEGEEIPSNRYFVIKTGKDDRMLIGMQRSGGGNSRQLSLEEFYAICFMKGWVKKLELGGKTMFFVSGNEVTRRGEISLPFFIQDKKVVSRDKTRTGEAAVLVSRQDEVHGTIIETYSVKKDRIAEVSREDGLEEEGLNKLLKEKETPDNCYYFNKKLGKILHFRSAELSRHYRVRSIQELDILSVLQGQEFSERQKEIMYRRSKFIKSPTKTKNGELSFYNLENVKIGSKSYNNGKRFLLKLEKGEDEEPVIKCFVGNKYAGFMRSAGLSRAEFTENPGGADKITGTRVNESKSAVFQPSAIALTMAEGNWGQYYIDQAQHEIINEVWGRLWDKTASLDRTHWLFEDLRFILKDEGFEELEMNVHIVPEKELYDRIYALAGQRHVSFPPHHKFRLITHPGTGSGEGLNAPRSANFLIPEEVLRLFSNYRQTIDGGLAYEEWLEHETFHIVAKMRKYYSEDPEAAAGIDEEEKITARNSIKNFIRFYVREVLKEETGKVKQAFPGGRALKKTGESGTRVNALPNNRYSIIFEYLCDKKITGPKNGLGSPDIASALDFSTDILPNILGNLIELDILRADIMVRDGKGKQYGYFLTGWISRQMEDIDLIEQISAALRYLPENGSRAFRDKKDEIIGIIQNIKNKYYAEELLFSGNAHLRAGIFRNYFNREKYALPVEKVEYEFTGRIDHKGYVLFPGVENPLKVCSEQETHLHGERKINFRIIKKNLGGDRVEIRVWDNRTGKYKLAKFYKRMNNRDRIKWTSRGKNRTADDPILSFLRGTCDGVIKKSVSCTRDESGLMYVNEQGRVFYPGYGNLTFCERNLAGKKARLVLKYNNAHGNILKCQVEISYGKWQTTNIYYYEKNKLRHLRAASAITKIIGLDGMDIIAFLRQKKVQVRKKKNGMNTELVTSRGIRESGRVELAHYGVVYAKVCKEGEHTGERGRLVLVEDEVLRCPRLDCYAGNKTQPDNRYFQITDADGNIRLVHCRVNAGRYSRQLQLEEFYLIAFLNGWVSDMNTDSRDIFCVSYGKVDVKGNLYLPFLTGKKKIKAAAAKTGRRDEYALFIFKRDEVYGTMIDVYSIPERTAVRLKKERDIETFLQQQKKPDNCFYIEPSSGEVLSSKGVYTIDSLSQLDIITLFKTKNLSKKRKEKILDRKKRIFSPFIISKGRFPYFGLFSVLVGSKYDGKRPEIEIALDEKKKPVILVYIDGNFIGSAGVGSSGEVVFRKKTVMEKRPGTSAGVESPIPGREQVPGMNLRGVRQKSIFEHILHQNEFDKFFHSVSPDPGDFYEKRTSAQLFVDTVLNGSFIPGNEKKKTVLIMGTDWIWDYNSKKALQYIYIKKLLVEVRKFCASNNIEFITCPDDNIPGIVSEKDPSALNVVVLMSGDTLLSASEDIKKMSSDKRICIAGVDPQKIENELSYHRIMEMIGLLLRLSYNHHIRFYKGKGIICYVSREEPNVFLFVPLPESGKLELEELKRRYDYMCDIICNA